jgi:hypothetical protein
MPAPPDLPSPQPRSGLTSKVRGSVSSDAATRARFLKRTGFLLMAASADFFALFVAGAFLTHPGGWSGLASVASWPAAMLAVAGWPWPQRAVAVFAALTAAVIALEVWCAINPHGWRSFEDEHGPVSMIATFVVVARSQGPLLAGRASTAVGVGHPGAGRGERPWWRRVRATDAPIAPTDPGEAAMIFVLEQPAEGRVR